jgi:hypothetical protein
MPYEIPTVHSTEDNFMTTISEANLENLNDLEDISIAEQRLKDIQAGKVQTIPIEEIMRQYNMMTPQQRLSSGIDSCNFQAQRLEMALRHLKYLLPFTEDTLQNLSDADLGFCEMRNSIANDYPEPPAALAASLNLCMQKAREMLDFWQTFQEKIKKKLP